MYSKIRKVMNKQYILAAVVLAVAFLLMLPVWTRSIHDHDVFAAISTLSLICAVFAVILFLQAIFGNTKAKLKIPKEKRKHWKESFRDEKAKEFQGVDLCMADGILAITRDWPVVFIPAKSVSKMFYSIDKKEDKAGNKPFWITLMYGKDEIISIKGKDSSDARRIYCELYKAIHAENPDVISLSEHTLYEDDKKILRQAYDHYKDSYHLELLPNADFTASFEESAFAIYLDVEGATHVIVVHAPKTIHKMIKTPNDKWGIVDEVVNENGYEGLIKEIDALIARKDEVRLTIRNNKILGVISLLLAIACIVSGIALLGIPDGVYMTFLIAVYALAFVYAAAFQLVWKIEFVDYKIKYRNIFGKTRIIDPEEIDEVKKRYFMNDYAFCSGGKKVFGINNLLKHIEAECLVEAINTVRKGKELKFPD